MAQVAVMLPNDVLRRSQTCEEFGKEEDGDYENFVASKVRFDLALNELILIESRKPTKAEKKAAIVEAALADSVRTAKKAAKKSASGKKAKRRK
jgi:hypothetical protein